MMAINKNKILFEFKHHLFGDYLPQELTEEQEKVYDSCISIVNNSESIEVIPLEWLKHRLDEGIKHIEFVSTFDSKVFATRADKDINKEKASALLDALRYTMQVLDEYEKETR